MRRGTTPTLILEMPDEISVSDLSEAILTIEQNKREIITKFLSDMTLDVDGNAMTISLTQEETLELQDSRLAEIQLKIKTVDGMVTASDVIRIAVKEILNEEVI